VSEFGNKFKTARELRGIKLDEIAQETRVSTRFLRAIEEERFADLPGGLFNRGFVRTYARAVGLDEEAMVEAYRAAVADQARTDTAPPPPPAPSPMSGIEQYVLPSAIGGLVVLVFLFYVSTRGGDSPPAPSPPVPEVAEVISGTPAAARGAAPQQVGPETEADAPMAAGPQPGATEESPPEPVLDARATPPTRPSAFEPPVPPPTQVRAPAEVLAEVASERPDSPASVSPLTVRVEVHAPTWMYVELDGEVKYENITINPPFWRNYSVNEALELRIGNPSGVSLSVNGEPLSALGPADEVWTATITPENVSRLTGS
jgi:cytoskeleton protein RodZ